METVSTITVGQSGPRINDNVGALHIPQSSKTRALRSDDLVSYPRHSVEGDLPLCRDAFSIFCNCSQLGLTMVVIKTKQIKCASLYIRDGNRGRKS